MVTPCLPSAPYPLNMELIRRRNPQAALSSLEAAAISARGGFRLRVLDSRGI